MTVAKLSTVFLRTGGTSDIDDALKRMMCLIAASDEPPEVKEHLAEVLLSLMNLLDLENEKAKYKDIDQKRRARGRGAS